METVAGARPRPAFRRALIGLVALMGVLAAAVPGEAEVDDDRFESPAWGIRLTAPKGWLLTDKTAYPNVLLWMVKTNPRVKMLLSAERLGRPLDASSYAAETAVILQTLGFQVRAPQLHSATGAYWLDADNGEAYLRQAYLVVGDRGFSLTMAAGDGPTRSSHLRAFDYVLRSIRAQRPRSPQEPGALDAGVPPTDGAQAPTGEPQ